MREGLKAARIAKRYSVAELSKIAGISPSVYYKWEDGSRDPLLTNAKQLADILGKTVDELFFCPALDKSSNEEFETEVCNG